MAEIKVPCVCPVCKKERLVSRYNLRKYTKGGMCQRCCSASIGKKTIRFAIAGLIKHGAAHQPIYHRWFNMIQRCTNRNHSSYHKYGARGISVCDRWLKFENFYADMGEPPKGMSIERRDNNGNYCPDNCHWATAKEQCNNQRRNHLLTFNGKTQSIANWSRELGMNYNTLRSRIQFGWPVDRALTTPFNQHY